MMAGEFRRLVAALAIRYQMVVVFMQGAATALPALRAPGCGRYHGAAFQHYLL